MDLHEYQAKMVLEKYGVKVPDYAVFKSVTECKKIVEALNLDSAVLKVQIHAGGRGKAGGVKICREKDQILKEAEKLIGLKIINNQTGKEGIIAKEVLISPLVNYKKEYYLGAVIDREKGEAILIASKEGGVEIEELARKSPQKIIKWPLRLDGSFRNYELIKLAKLMGFKGITLENAKKLFEGVAKCFVETDASLVEINPLVETEDGELIALDAKMSIDDNALYRQRELAKLYDETQLKKNDALAKEHDLAYVSLEGNIGCMVNGAGLAMATMDIIHLAKGKPANFLDVGGSATEDKIAEGFRIILLDDQVKAILVNIFGGIMNCVTLAAGIIVACGDEGLKVPLVVRMEGTNVELGKKMLQDSGLNIIIADDLEEAANKVVECLK